MPVSRLGELAALGTSVSWTCSALFFSAAGRRIGSLATNILRLGFAVIFLSLATLVLRGHLLPHDASAFTWRWLALSGFVGLVFGDLCQFRAFVVLGPRLTLLVVSLAPLFTAALGRVVLGEVLSLQQLAGMAVTIAGIALALTAHRNTVRSAAEGHWSWRGALLALGGAVGQAGALVLSKYGMRGYDPMASTQIRVIAALACFLVGFTIAGLWPRVVAGLRHSGGLRYTALGALFGPVIGVTLSLVAVVHAPAGVAASLMALAPLLILPVSAWRGEHVGWGGLAGAVLAVAGVALLVTG
ncbi:MAG: DMT family transporter [Acidobacteriota bacterium]